MRQHESIAIIPARGGSKRIPKKNIKDFHGKPIIAYSIEKAKASFLFTRVIVSTDSTEIADIAKACGAEVPFLRPAELADDFTGTLDVMAHAVRESQKLFDFDYVCCLYPTAPLMRIEDLKQGHEKLDSGRFDYVFSAKRYDFTPFRAFTGHDQCVKLLFPEHEQTRSQDLPPVYHDAAQFYWAQKTAFLEKKSIFSERSGFVEIPALYAQDIDTLEDWELALFKYGFIQSQA